MQRGAAGKMVWPPASYDLKKDVTAWFVRPGRLLLFISLNKQADNSNDQNTDLNQICVCHHCQPPFPEIRGQEAPPDVSRGPNRLPLFGSAMVRIAQKSWQINLFCRKNASLSETNDKKRRLHSRRRYFYFLPPARSNPPSMRQITTFFKIIILKILKIEGNLGFSPPDASLSPKNMV